MNIKSGVYEIVNKLNNKRYIGSSIDIDKRIKGHFCELEKDNHKNRYLQNSWNKYGSKAFHSNILEIVADCKKLVQREQCYMDLLKPEYNISPTAGSNLGLVTSEQTKEKLSKIMKGRKITWVDKIIEANQGEKCHNARLSEKQVEKIKLLYQEKSLLQKEIAKMFGVSRATIGSVLNGNRWKHTKKIDISQISEKRRAANRKPTGLLVCSNCGEKVKMTSFAQKYCSLCAKEREKEHGRTWMQKKRDMLPKKIKMLICTECGGEAIKGSNVQKYCPACAIEKKRECRNNHYRRKYNAKTAIGEIMGCQKCGKEVVRNSAAQRYCRDCTPRKLKQANCKGGDRGDSGR